MFYENTQGVTRYHAFQELEQINGLVHAFSIRREDLSKGPEPLGQIRPDKTLLIQSLGLRAGSLILLRQVHSDRVVETEPEGESGVEPSLLGPADAAVTTGTGQFLVVRTADCVPVLIVLPKQRRVCCIHAGWRGARDRIAEKAARFFFQSAGADPGGAVAAIGPCIRSCCYQVGPEVCREYESAGHEVGELFSEGRLDLVRSIRIQLSQAGIESVLDSGGCTSCRNDLWYSYRREGNTGRNWMVAGFRDAVI